MALWRFNRVGWSKCQFARPTHEHDVYICAPGPSLADVNTDALRGPGRTVIAITTAYPRVKPDVWIGMDKPYCYDAGLFHEAFPKIVRGTYRDEKATDGRLLRDCENTLFADVAPAQPIETLTKRGDDVPFVWQNDTLTVALHYAVLIGAQRIHLVGMNMGGTRDYYDDRVLPDGLRARNRALYRQQVQRLSAIAEEAEPRGIEVVSCTADSPLNAVMAYIPLADALADSAAVVRPNKIVHACEKPDNTESRPVMLHLNRYMVVGGAEAYIRSMIHALPEYAHHLYVKYNMDIRAMRALRRAGVQTIESAPDGNLQDIVNERKAQVVIWHNWEVKPTAATCPLCRVYHGAWVTPSSVFDANVAVSEDSVRRLNAPGVDVTVIPPAGVYPRVGERAVRDGRMTVGQYGSDRQEKHDHRNAAILWNAQLAGNRILFVGRKQVASTFGEHAEYRPASVLRRWDYLREMDVALFRTGPKCIEGFGIACMEAMLFGVVPVAEARGGYLDQIQDGVNGFLVDHDDVAGFMRRIAELRENRVMLHTMSARAQESAQRAADINVFAERWRRVLAKVNAGYEARNACVGSDA